MRIQLASDLHLECLQGRFPSATLISPAPDADLLVLAGDIHNGAAGVHAFARWPVPVLYVAGNHEAYEGELEDVLAQLQAAARGTSVVVLDDAPADLRGFGAWSRQHGATLDRVRFLGTTLWTDYRLPSAGADPVGAMAEAARRVVDHRLIRTRTGPFTPHEALRRHEASRRWLE